MIALLVWFVGALVAIPLLGRWCAKTYTERPRKSDQVSPVTFGLVYGLCWPVVAVLMTLGYAYDRLSKTTFPNWLRSVITGTDRKF